MFVKINNHLINTENMVTPYVCNKTLYVINNNENPIARKEYETEELALAARDKLLVYLNNLKPTNKIININIK